MSVTPTGNTRSLATNQGQKEVISISYQKFSNPQIVFNKAKILEQTSTDEIKFLIGNTLFTDSKGNKNFVCENFSEARLIFEADGLFIEGEKVLMELTSPCKINEKHDFIGPFAIPSKQIIRSPINQEYFEYKESQIYFSNVSLKWPRDWVLTKVHFKKTDSEEFFTVIKEFSEKNNEFFTISL